MKSIIEQLNWRYAVKKYDATKKISKENILLLQNTLRLTPSCFGLQPYRILFIENETVREKLREASFGQSQITEASHLVVFAIENNIDETFVDSYFENVCQTRRIKLEGNLLHHKNSVLGSINKKSADEKRNWASNQAYIALGNLLIASAQLEIDTSPMEGFMPHKYDEILGLQSQGLSSVVISAIGYRHEEDIFQHFIKVRKPSNELFINI